jgi:homoserine O-succinyltransferase
VTGHPEYDPHTLASEYFRDVEAGLESGCSVQLFPERRSAKQTESNLAQPREFAFTNWLNYYVYQITPYDLRHMNPTLE